MTRDVRQPCFWILDRSRGVTHPEGFTSHRKALAEAARLNRLAETFTCIPRFVVTPRETRPEALRLVTRAP